MGEMEEAGQRGQYFRQLGEIHFSVGSFILSVIL